MDNKLYQEPTPAFHHSYGYNREMRLTSTQKIEERTNRILQSNKTLYSIMKKEELRIEDELNIREGWRKATERSPSRVFQQHLAREDKLHLKQMHSWPWQTLTESQNIGWFADPKRQLPCRFRQLPEYYSFV